MLSSLRLIIEAHARLEMQGSSQFETLRDSSLKILEKAAVLRDLNADKMKRE